MATSIEASMGHQGTITINSTNMVFVSESLAKKQSHVSRDALRGTRKHDVDDVVPGVNTVDGTIVLEPTNAELAVLLPLIMGNTATNVLNEALTDFTIVVGRDYDTFTYAGCKIDVARFSGRPGEILRLSLDVVAKTSGATGTAPAEPASVRPFIFSEVKITLQSGARQVSEFEMIVNNHLIRDRFMNNRDLTEIPEGDRTITLRTVHPFGTNSYAGTDLYNQALAGAAGTLALSGAGTRTFTFTKLQVPAEDPTVAGRGEIPLVLNMVSRGDGATKELVVT